MEKVKSVVKKAKDTLETAIRIGKTIVGGIIGVVGLTIAAVIAVFIGLFIACGALLVPAAVAIFVASLLELGSSWALVFFLALVLILWC